MNNIIPTLDEHRRVLFQSASDFRLALDAAKSADWIIVLPRLTVQIGRPLMATLLLEGLTEPIRVTLVPGFWKGPYLGAQVSFADEAARQLALKVRDVSPKTTVLAEDLDDIGPVSPPTVPNMAQTLARSGDDLDELLHVGDLVEESLALSEADAIAEMMDDDTQLDICEEETTDNSLMRHDVLDLTPTTPPPIPLLPPHMAASTDRAEVAFQSAPSTPVGMVAAADVNELFAPLSLCDPPGHLPSHATITRLLAHLALYEMTGILELEVPNGYYRVHVHAGAVRSVDPPDFTFDAHVGRMLVADRLLSHKDLEALLPDSQQRHCPVAALCFERGLIPLDTLTRYLRSQKEFLVRKVLSIPGQARFRFLPLAAAQYRYDLVRVALAPLLTLAVRQTLLSLPEQELKLALVQHLQQYPLSRDSTIMSRDALMLTSREEELVETLMTGVHSLGELPDLVSFSARELFSAVLLLQHFGFVDWQETRRDSTDSAAVLRSLEDRLSFMMKADHFARLGIHWASHPSRIEQAQRSLSNRFSNGSTLFSFSKECAALCRGIHALVAKSAAFLSSEEKRRSYRIETIGLPKVEYAARYLHRYAQKVHDAGHVVSALFVLESARDLIDDASWGTTAEQWKSQLELTPIPSEKR
jgi:hypothetical protein